MHVPPFQKYVPLCTVEGNKPISFSCLRVLLRCFIWFQVPFFPATLLLLFPFCPHGWFCPRPLFFCCSGVFFSVWLFAGLLDTPTSPLLMILAFFSDNLFVTPLPFVLDLCDSPSCFFFDDTLANQRTCCCGQEDSPHLFSFIPPNPTPLMTLFNCTNSADYSFRFVFPFSAGCIVVLFPCS